MDHKKWKTVSQEITCPECGITVPRKQTNQRFCTPAHQRKWWAKQRNYPQEIRKCVVCNDDFECAKRHKTKTCSKFCSDVASSVDQQLWTDEELIHLMLLNRGLGVARFADKVMGDKTRGHGNSRVLDRVLYIIDYMKEEENLDLFSILSDPAGLIEMRLDDWVAAGKPTAATKMHGGPGNKMRRNQYMVSRELRMQVDDDKLEFDMYNPGTHRKVKVYPEFNWGPYKKRYRVKK